MASVFKPKHMYVTFDPYLEQKLIKSAKRIKRTTKKRPTRKLIQGNEFPSQQVWAQIVALLDKMADLAIYLTKS